MNINDVTARKEYVGNGVTTIFAYDFGIVSTSDIEVIVGGVVQTLGTHYSVSGAGVDAGGNVTFVVAPSNAVNVILLRKQPFSQLSVYQANEDFPAKRLETDLSKEMMAIQQLREIVSRAPQFLKSSLLKNPILPDGVTGNFVRWKSTTELENANLVGLGILGIPVFTIGDVPFASGINSLSRDSTKFVWDNTNKRLIIGTSVSSVAALTVVPTGNDGGVTSIVNATTGAIALNGVSAATGSPAVKGESTAYYGGLFFNITDAGSDVANANMIGLVGQSVYSNALYTQQGAVSGPGSTLARNNIYSASYVTRVVGSLNGFNYTAPLFRIDDTTSSTGILMDVKKQGTIVFAMSITGKITLTPVSGVAMDVTNGINFSGSATITGPGIVRSGNTLRISGGATGVLFVSSDNGTQVAVFGDTTGMQLGSPTGGDKGIGTLNAQSDIYTGGATFLLRKNTTLTDGAGASTGTLTNAPAAGNPTKWISIDDNGTTRKIPAW